MAFAVPGFLCYVEGAAAEAAVQILFAILRLPCSAIMLAGWWIRMFSVLARARRAADDGVADGGLLLLPLVALACCAVLWARSLWLLVRALLAATGAAAGDGLLLLLPLVALSLCADSCAAARGTAGGKLLALLPLVALAWCAELRM